MKTALHILVITFLDFTSQFLIKDSQNTDWRSILCACKHYTTIMDATNVASKTGKICIFVRGNGHYFSTFYMQCFKLFCLVGCFIQVTIDNPNTGVGESCQASVSSSPGLTLVHSDNLGGCIIRNLLLLQVPVRVCNFYFAY